MNIVVGSGPAGVACAQALVAAGQPVTLCDGGETLEADRATQKRRLASLDPAAWTRADLAFMTPSDMSEGVPDKTSFGSLYPYRGVARATQAAAKPSFAVGGLSTVWGGAILPYRDADLRGWPLAAADLKVGYAAALKLMPFAAQADDLEGRFPLHRLPDAPMPLSRQAKATAVQMIRNRAALATAGIAFGGARLAVDANACVRCGLCLRGCPHDLIYAAGTTLAALRATGAVNYRPGFRIQRVEETSAGVRLYGQNIDGSADRLEGSRAFLAAGVIGTTDIMLRSSGRPSRAAVIKDSQYFLLPVLRFGGAGDVERERLHTLAQLFIEIFDDAISPFAIHLQAYSYNDMIRDAVRRKLGALHKMLPMSAILGRLMLLQGYLHSDHSGVIEATLRGDGLHLVGKPNTAARPMIAALTRKLLALCFKTGLLPLSPLLEITEPGRGFHIGGSFPMARVPEDGETDLFGRPAGLARVHLVDASVFPSIPATTITLTAMANAHRIAAAVARGALS